MAKKRRRTAYALAGTLIIILAVSGLFLLLRGPDPFWGEELYVDPDSPAARQAAQWRDSRPTDAAEMAEIAAEPRAYWFGSHSENIQREVDERVSAITQTGALPVLVAYHIPHLSCTGDPGQGAPSHEAYRAWVRAFAAGIGEREAVVILEPDALAQAEGCISAAERERRSESLEYAIRTLKSGESTAVYVDAGHPDWVDAAEMARRLTGAGISQADGFSLNVSAFQRTADILAYGREISSRVGDEHFVIDTSRNGLGPAPGGEWCNPPGRALGERPTTETADPLADAYLWIKPPGESDGECNGGPPAGQWWADYALGLARRADY